MPNVKQLLEEIAKLNDKINKLEVDLVKLRNDYLYRSERAHEIREDQIETIRNSNLAISFKTINAFSIERLIKDEIEQTSIGYLNSKGEVSEWIFTCNNEIHERLVKEFRSEILGVDDDL